ncbi:MAG TPA: CRISPR-associated protein Cas4 [Hungateiclostridium thermocellum]|uniref:CRISPR-associated exonuclease Cas4 n=1 Tax=Acetivibrio thermocellus (strain ATCC 27405 / DSM 1237 / JCM 9322 / NBRC 103400 / NCIMB 10682 / NRRL B-4536 / VPI 7372) TaxID=203119 RepID=A3DKD6_ACET2|nr:CRISPR-associated protein Cas4 [Acetivibrio thermocellus]ABN54415.1 CRISPR-associated protein Cas4 [Acetivibrio thermocellus ATCC 27405]THJ79178.1 CRISPR-associated protein Cas4 [Acetivibrio thermocellus]CDG37698.1 CRISPR-associated Cas4 family protein [Acetivibrio thermocellus BC1]HBW28318.1 CRISPR-associated protein Cas4 [Acetivibrio thermocellus]
MKSSQSFFNENQYYITPSDMIEFLYCKRYIYYMKCLGIDQNVEKRFKVMIGREIHEKRGEQNKNYLPKKIGSIHKMIGVNLVSEKYGIKGNADEVHTLADGTMAPLDYKFARYDERLFKTYKNQLVMYAIMIEETFGRKVNKGFLVYCREGNRLVEVCVTEEDKDKLCRCIEEYKMVLDGYYPEATKQKSKCLDCCYKNICIKI